jgi:hypothetical protein
MAFDDLCSHVRDECLLGDLDSVRLEKQKPRGP